MRAITVIYIFPARLRRRLRGAKPAASGPRGRRGGGGRGGGGGAAAGAGDRSIATSAPRPNFHASAITPQAYLYVVTCAFCRRSFFGTCEATPTNDVPIYSRARLQMWPFQTQLAKYRGADTPFELNPSPYTNHLCFYLRISCMPTRRRRTPTPRCWRSWTTCCRGAIRAKP